MNWLQVIRLVTIERERRGSPRTPTGMEKSKTLMKTLVIALLAGASLSGCIAVPVYDTPRVYGPPAVVVQPFFGFGYGGGYYGGRHGRW
jgi:hypothetical protein